METNNRIEVIDQWISDNKFQFIILDGTHYCHLSSEVPVVLPIRCIEQRGSFCSGSYMDMNDTKFHIHDFIYSYCIIPQIIKRLQHYKTATEETIADNNLLKSELEHVKAYWDLQI